MTQKNKKQCRWTTNRGERCKHTAVGRTELCFKHNLTIRFRTYLIIGIITILVSAVIAFFLPEIRNSIFREKTLLQRVKIEGERATSIGDKTQVPAHAHNLRELGLLALRNRDFAAYKQAIWQMLRVHTLSWTSQWPPGPEGRLARHEVYDQLVKLLTTERLRYLTHRLEISGMLGNVAVAGTEGNVKEYNLGNFFSDNLFTETLEVMRRAIDTLWWKGDTQFAHFVFEVMRDVILAEAHRRLDQGYRICPIATDRPQLTASAQRIADVGQPRALDSYYRACRTMSKVPEPLLTEFLTSDYYYRLSYVLGVDETVEEQKCSPEDVRKWRYYSGRGTFLLTVSSSAESLVIDSLVSSCNRRRQAAADCVRQLVRRERYPAMWKNN
jgi:hypothetical protein